MDRRDLFRQAQGLPRPGGRQALARLERRANEARERPIKTCYNSSWMEAPQTADELLKLLISVVLKQGPFTETTPDDWQVRTVDQHGTGFHFKAVTPRGALFLGELASAGFFGPQTQADLSLEVLS
jgi:hypothetical protein